MRVCFRGRFGSAVEAWRLAVRRNQAGVAVALVLACCVALLWGIISLATTNRLSDIPSTAFEFYLPLALRLEARATAPNVDTVAARFQERRSSSTGSNEIPPHMRAHGLDVSVARHVPLVDIFHRQGSSPVIMNAFGESVDAYPVAGERDADPASAHEGGKNGGTVAANGKTGSAEDGISSAAKLRETDDHAGVFGALPPVDDAHFNCTELPLCRHMLGAAAPLSLLQEKRYVMVLFSTWDTRHFVLNQLAILAHYGWEAWTVVCSSAAEARWFQGLGYKCFVHRPIVFTVPVMHRAGKSQGLGFGTASSALRNHRALQSAPTCLETWALERVRALVSLAGEDVGVLYVSPNMPWKVNPQLLLEELIDRKATFGFSELIDGLFEERAEAMRQRVEKFAPSVLLEMENAVTTRGEAHMMQKRWARVLGLRSAAHAHDALQLLDDTDTVVAADGVAAIDDVDGTRKQSMHQEEHALGLNAAKSATASKGNHHCSLAAAHAAASSPYPEFVFLEGRRAFAVLAHARVPVSGQSLVYMLTQGIGTVLPAAPAAAMRHAGTEKARVRAVVSSEVGGELVITAAIAVDIDGNREHVNAFGWSAAWEDAPKKHSWGWKIVNNYEDFANSDSAGSKHPRSNAANKAKPVEASHRGDLLGRAHHEHEHQYTEEFKNFLTSIYYQHISHQMQERV